MMNSFEQYTLVIGFLAILFEGIRHLKEKLRAWLQTHAKAR
jgi:hypothetical protein